MVMLQRAPQMLQCIAPTGHAFKNVRMDETHRKCSRNSISSAVRFIIIIFLSHARDCTSFTLHDLTEFLRKEGDSAPH